MSLVHLQLGFERANVKPVPQLSASSHPGFPAPFAECVIFSPVFIAFGIFIKDQGPVSV